MYNPPTTIKFRYGLFYDDVIFNDIGRTFGLTTNGRQKAYICLVLDIKNVVVLIRFFLPFQLFL